MDTATSTGRFINMHDGKGLVDTQMHPRVLQAQEEAEARRHATHSRKARPKTGFSEPSEDALRRKKEES